MAFVAQANHHSVNQAIIQVLQIRDSDWEHFILGDMNHMIIMIYAVTFQLSFLTAGLCCVTTACSRRDGGRRTTGLVCPAGQTRYDTRSTTETTCSNPAGQFSFRLVALVASIDPRLPV